MNNKSTKKAFTKEQKLRTKRDYDSLRNASIRVYCEQFTLNVKFIDTRKNHACKLQENSQNLQNQAEVFVQEKELSLNTTQSNTSRKIRKSRLGLIVSKKVGNSVKRNRVKRLFREIFRLNISNFDYIFDVIVIAKKEVLTSDFFELEKQFLNLIEKSYLRYTNSKCKL